MSCVTRTSGFPKDGRIHLTDAARYLKSGKGILDDNKGSTVDEVEFCYVAMVQPVVTVLESIFL